MEIVFFAGDYLALNLRVHGAHIAYHDKVIFVMVWHVIILLVYIVSLVLAVKKEGSAKFNYLVLYGGFFLAVALSLVACSSIA